MKKQKGSPCGEAGQTLIEILLAFSVSILVLSAIIIGITTSLSNTQFTRNQNSANSYVQEGMSVVRNIKESGWAQFSSYANPLYCLDQNSVTLTEPIPPSLTCGQNISDIFSREVKFEHNSQSCCSNLSPTCENGIKGSKVTVKVSWSDNKCPVGTPLCHDVELITCLSNVDQKQSP